MISSTTQTHQRTAAGESPRSSTVSSAKQLGEELRQYRDHVGMTEEAAAEDLPWSQDRLTQSEHGTRHVTQTELNALIRVYEIGSREAKRLHSLRTRARKEPVAVDVPSRYQRFHDLQVVASVQRTYAPSLLPPICRIEAYAEELAQPATALDAQNALDQAKYHVQHSQVVLKRNPPMQVQLVVGEGALYNLAGSRKTMIKQLDHLIRLAKLPHVELLILPFAETGHAVVDGGYTVLTDDQAGSWLCMDDLIATTCTDDPVAVAAHQKAFSMLTTRAFDRQVSIDRLSAVRQSHFTASQRRKDIDNEVCRRLRSKFKLTVAELAAVFDCSVDTISLHLGRYQPTDALAEPVPSDTP